MKSKALWRFNIVMKIKSGILGVGSYLPEKCVDNFYFEGIMDTSNEWITTRTGIKERRVAAEEEATSDLAIKASLKALECANLAPEDIDLIILATLTPDMLLPSTACIVQEGIGAVNAAAFDISAACTGFVYALTIAKQFVENDTYKNILVVGSETSSRVLNYEDRATSVLFGDGSGAAVVGRVEDGGILSTYLGADGKGKDYLKIPAGGSRNKASQDTIQNNMHTIHMAGSDVFKFAVRKMAETSLIAIEKANLEAKDIDLYVPHQANARIIEASAKRLGLSMDSVFVNLDKYGNMSAASIPVALDEAYREGKIKKGDKIVVVGFGGGLTWGSSVIEWTL
jgi:3-oxoacyl-[acyl-carrier-protein] synthase-3